MPTSEESFIGEKIDASSMFYKLDGCRKALLALLLDLGVRNSCNIVPIEALDDLFQRHVPGSPCQQR
jgi:hypothetical protein